MDTSHLLTQLQDHGLEIGLRVLGALVIWIIGRYIIRGVRRLVGAALDHRHTDPTLVRYAQSMVSIVLNLGLLITVLSFFGVETTSFAALIAAGGIAIGMAWSGLLANFAAGVFLLVLKPFKVGDLIGAGGVIGTVRELGLFATAIETTDGVLTFVGNNKLFTDNIQNMTDSHARRVDLLAQLAHGVDPMEARERLRARIASIPNVLAQPAPTVEIIDFTPMGPVLAVRPHTDNANYWQVYFATSAAIAEVFSAAAYPAPYTQQRLLQEQVSLMHPRA